MNSSLSSTIIITPHVVNTVKSLPESDRKAIVEALAADILLGVNPDEVLSPFQSILYSMIKFYVERDSVRAARKCS